MATRHIWPISEETVRRQARIIPHGAAAKAVADAEERRSRGEVVTFYEGVERGRSYLFVGPPLPTPQ